MPNANQFPERLIKKYPNRRLYDTQASSYITLLDVKKLVMESVSFSVCDARTGEDLTRSILLQIVMEEEEAGKPLLSASMLSIMIRYYGHAMQDKMAHALETNMQTLAAAQDAIATSSVASAAITPAEGANVSDTLDVLQSAATAPILANFPVNFPTEQPGEMRTLNS